LQIARSQNDLAILYLTKQNYRKAKDFAQAAEAELATDERASVTDRMIAQLILSEALCYLKECVSAIPLLKANLEAAKTKMSSNDFPIGVSKFLLGFGYWKSGDMSRAEEYLRDGIAQMGIQLGWGHPTYVRALRQYAYSCMKPIRWRQPAQLSGASGSRRLLLMFIPSRRHRGCFLLVGCVRA
jgi:hypothetical protein